MKMFSRQVLLQILLAHCWILLASASLTAWTRWVYCDYRPDLESTAAVLHYGEASHRKLTVLGDGYRSYSYGEYVEYEHGDVLPPGLATTAPTGLVCEGVIEGLRYHVGGLRS